MNTNEFFPGSLDKPMSDKAKRIIQWNRERIDGFVLEYKKKFKYFHSVMPEAMVLSKCTKPSKVKKFKKLIKYMERQQGIPKNEVWPSKVGTVFVLQEGKLIEVEKNQ